MIVPEPFAAYAPYVARATLPEADNLENAMTQADQDFYASLPVFDGFSHVMEPANYRPLPQDWLVGSSDVVESTKAIGAGRYKAVNMVGAGVIAGIANALERRSFPFSFGGDGASFAVAPADAARASEALAAMAVFAREELQLALRVATIPVAKIRASGRDVRVARFAPSPNTDYAMFAGGGLAWFEREMKSGGFALPAAAAGARPDLTGLSCRWRIAPAAHGVILSVIVVPRGEDARFRGLIEEIVEITSREIDGGRPVSLALMKLDWPSESIALETVATSQPGPQRLMRRLKTMLWALTGIVFCKFNMKTRDLDSRVYTGDIVANADFRKFDDGLRMTLDCTAAMADALEARLLAAGAYAAFGTFRQKEAQMTCFVPTITDRSHVHFVDGAGGGYAMAAQAMKARHLT